MANNNQNIGQYTEEEWKKGYIAHHKKEIDQSYKHWLRLHDRKPFIGKIKKLLEDYIGAGGRLQFGTQTEIGARGIYSPSPYVSKKEDEKLKLRKPFGKIGIKYTAGPKTVFHEFIHLLDDLYKEDVSVEGKKKYESFTGETIESDLVRYQSEIVRSELEEKQDKDFEQLLEDLKYKGNLPYLARPTETVAHTVTGAEFSEQIPTLLNPFKFTFGIGESFDKRVGTDIDIEESKSVQDLVKMVEHVKANYDVARNIVNNPKAKEIFSKQSIEFLNEYLDKQYSEYLDAGEEGKIKSAPLEGKDLQKRILEMAEYDDLDRMLRLEYPSIYRAFEEEELFKRFSDEERKMYENKTNYAKDKFRRKYKKTNPLRIPYDKLKNPSKY